MSKIHYIKFKKALKTHVFKAFFDFILRGPIFQLRAHKRRC
jgi:hypothetical protein